MGIYSDLTIEELQATRKRLRDSLHDRLTKATSASFEGRSAQYQQRTDDIRREIEAVGLELDRRAGRVTRGPIYLA